MNKPSLVRSAGLAILFISALSLAVSRTSLAQEFTATSLGDFGNVTVMEVAGNYDADNPDGTVNAIPRQTIAREFFKTHRDEYDFLVIFTNFDFRMPDKEVKGFYEGVKNDTQGIGIDLFDNTALYGSNGVLQGTIDMDNIKNNASDPLDPAFKDTLYTLSHEIMHRWGANVKFRRTDGTLSTDLLGKDGDHWSFLLDSGGSVMYGNQWQDNGNGTFTSTVPQSQMKLYSPLDLYLMGMIDKSQVPPMLLIDGPDVDPAQLPLAGVTVSGTAQYVTIDQIIAAVGPRVPDAAHSQKSFKTAFIYITQPGSFASEDIYGIENIRSAWVTRHSILTDGKSIVQVAATVKDDVPVNPGVLPPSTTPRTLPPDINDGVSWLMGNQLSDGSWLDLVRTRERDTAEATLVLKDFSPSEQNYRNGLLWLQSTNSGNLDYLARKIEASAGAGEDVAGLVQEVLLQQNQDGGWGTGANYASNNSDTAMALKALAATDYPGPEALNRAVEFLKNRQNTDGSWGSEDRGGMVQETSNVLSAFNTYRSLYQLDDALSLGTAWLTAKQNTDGGFGNSPSTVYDTASAVLALRELDVPTDVTNKALDYLLSRQSGDGSWDGSAYQTALAVAAVYKATVDPDLSVKPEDVTFIPASITTLPTNVVINADIANLGRTAVPQAKVVLYDEDPALGNVAGEQVLAFPGQQTTTVTFSIEVRDGSEHTYYLVVDPDNLIKEQNELNNRAVRNLKPQATYDFEVLPSDVAVSTSPADLFQDVTITAKITNRGTMNAYNVQVRYFIEDPAGPFEIATRTVDILAGATVTGETVWRTNRAGTDMPLTVQVDPFESFAELSETNNKASATITVNPDTRPNLTISYRDIVVSPNPANEGGDMNISALVRNEGLSSSGSFTVSFYRGVPGADGMLIGSQTIPTLASGMSVTASVDWVNVPEAGERLITVIVDPESRLSEITRADNEAFTTLTILSLPDLMLSENSIVFSPAAPKEGDAVSITATIQNTGDQGVSNVVVRFTENNTDLDTRTIPSLGGGATTTVSIPYDTTAKLGAHTITVTIDPDNAIREQSKNNNSSSRVFGVQNANLWITEPYFSPNGDGVKDSTRIFYSLSTDQTVTVSVVNEKSEVVRYLGSPVSTGSAAGNANWDGLDSNGMVAADGEYRLQLFSGNRSAEDSLLTVLDNNRSPMTDAVGTAHILNSNLTCMLPNPTSWQWFPDESGILVLINAENADTPEYPKGIYSVSPDGTDILRLVPWGWSDANDLRYRYAYGKYEASPDGSKIAFIVNVYNKNYYYVSSQLWVVDRDGTQLTAIDSCDDAATCYGISNFFWSPQGRHIAYSIGRAYSYTLTNLIANADGTGKIQLSEGGHDYPVWSPDGSRLALPVTTYDGASMTYTQRIRLFDLAGNGTDIFTFNQSGYHSYVGYLDWFTNDRLIIEAYSNGDYIYHLWTVDATGGGDNVTVSTRSSDFKSIYIAPDRRKFAFVENLYDDQYSGWLPSSVSANIFDGKGTTEVHEFAPRGNCWIEFGDISWSPDGKKLAFTESSESSEGGECTNIIGPRLVVEDLAQNTEKVFDNPMQLTGWLSDSTTAYGSVLNIYYDPYHNWTPTRYEDMYFTDVVTGETLSMSLPPATGPSSGGATAFSPLEHYFVYYQGADAASVCYTRGTVDLWSMTNLLNLTADLRAAQGKSGIVLKGVAADLNFEGYQLEYADTKTPSSWDPIAPPSNVPVINDTFTTWVPPYEGTFYVRLTVWDKAGNRAVSRRRVSWGRSSSITNLYKTADLFSPNGDGVQDTVELHYRVLEPIHLEFTVYNDADAPVKTFRKDHTAPAEDFISWDGTDESGSTVPDGSYTIKVFDYEFIVEVDTTPPDVNVALPPISFDPGIPMSVKAGVSGHGFDKNLKSWTLEYGHGDNPDTWHALAQGTNVLVKRDGNGEPYQPLQDVPLYGYSSPDQKTVCKFVPSFLSFSDWYRYDFPRGQKFRITAEDFAGNRSASISGVLDEGLYLLFMGMEQQEPYYSCPSDDLADDGNHQLLRVTTVRRPIRNLFLQEMIYGQWVDAQTLQNPDANVSGLEWYNAHSKPGLGAIRLKGVDDLGDEHFSNEIEVAPQFIIGLGCGNPLYYNSLQETLVTLKIQYQAKGELVWHDLWTDSNPGGLPQYTYRFDLPGVPYTSLPLGGSFSVRMAGKGMSGEEYYSNEATYPTYCPVVVKTQVTYEEADCDQVAPGRAKIQAATDKESTRAPFAAITLSYFLDTPEGSQLLRSIEQADLSKEPWGNATVDTSDMEEGVYPVTAVLQYRNLRTMSTASIRAAGKLYVDRVLPAAALTYPSGTSLKLCPVSMPGADGDWYGIPVEAVAQDNTGVSRYELYYGIGENPTFWQKATYPHWDELGQLNMRRIEGNGPAKGRIGTWDVSSLPGGTYTLKLKVVDIAGNISCAYATFSFDSLVEISNFVADSRVISPNNDGVLDDATVSYEIDKYATADVQVFKLVSDVPGRFRLDSMPVRTIAIGMQHLGGVNRVLWDGMSDAGSAVPDDIYGIAVAATDACGNTAQKWAVVEVDNTPPSVVISDPKPGDPLGNIIEIKGSAVDAHFQSYSLEAGQGSTPDTWALISNMTMPVADGVLGRWGTYGLEGTWTLRLTAYDRVGNRNETTVTVDLGMRKDLVKDLDAAPRLFSPNGDGKRESTTITYELTDACNVTIEFIDAFGTVKRTAAATADSPGIYTYAWDGKDNAGNAVTDGLYTVRLTALLSSNTSVTQTESVTVVVDATAPAIDINSPLDGSFSKTDVQVTGSITDASLAEYEVAYIGDTGGVQIDTGVQDRTGFLFGSLGSLAEGTYTLTASAQDQAENVSQKNLVFTIDRTPPAVKLDVPKDGGYYGTVVSAVSGTAAADQSSAAVNITGGIVEKNLDMFNLRYGPGDAPAQWTDLVTGATLTAYPSTYAWKVGKNDGIPDGQYTLSLFAKDKAGSTGEARVRVTIDNTPPTTAISSFQDGDYVKQPVEVQGTAFDRNIDKYTLDIAEGECASAFRWAPIANSSTSVQDGTLAQWQALPPDGEYCLKLTATDKVGSTSESTVNVNVDTHPPAALVLNGKAERKTDGSLTWTAGTEADIGGYNLYRNGEKVNTSLIDDVSYLDPGLAEGVYTYSVKAQDFAGWESPASNEVKLRIDLTGPTARISAPADGSRVSGLIDIKGTAFSSDDFKQYRLSVGPGAEPASWIVIRTSPVPVSYGVLAAWDALGLAEDAVYSIRLEAEDIAGNITTSRITVMIDNSPPAAPVLISASTNSADNSLTWQPNAEGDLAGYLLYRNDQLANVSGIVVGDLKPYLLSANTTTYLDQSLPDGTFRYYLAAMDQAGNVSGQSNTLEVTIDTHPPRAAITDPVDGATIGGKIFVKAESPDMDIASVQFQYQSIHDTAWTDLGDPVMSATTATYFDPSPGELGLSYGDYRLRAVATDRGQHTDPAPGYITVTYTDLTPPAAPAGLSALVSGGTVTLTWAANAESDLDGYNVYRDGEKINPAVVPGTVFRDQNLADGSYTYSITALDAHQNESKASDPAFAGVYAPVMTQPYTPTGMSTIQAGGTKAAAGATAELFAETASGPVSLGTTTTGADGAFAMGAALAPGLNRLFARVTDAGGNASRDSNAVVVVYNDTPAVPTGLAAAAQGSDVHLAWSRNAEPDLLGYNVFRDGVKLNAPDAAVPMETSASSYGYSSYDSWSVVDGDPATFWTPESGPSADQPAWWEMDLASPELVSRVSISWGAGTDGSGNEVLYAGKDFEVQVWSADASAWITQANVAGNAVKENIFAFDPAYRTDRIRIVITDSTDVNSAKQVRLVDVGVGRDNLVTFATTSAPSYDDRNLPNERYAYAVSAVDAYGFESRPTDTVSGDVNVAPPSAPVLSASVLNSDVTLTWTASPEPGTASYFVYRNTGSGWTGIAAVQAPETAFIDAAVPNGTYTYRVTAADAVGNESQPSNAATAAVLVAAPAQPTLAVTPTADGALQASWTYSGTPAAGYNLYRGLAAGGPYARVSGGLIADTAYLDTGLALGVTYYYVVAAVDGAGNEGGYSNEASGTPADTVAPAKPAVFFPTVPGRPVTVLKNSTAANGSAEPGVSVQLLDNGTDAGSAAARPEDDVRLQALERVNDNGASVSPDGQWLAYNVYDYDLRTNSIWLRSLVDGTERLIIPDGYLPYWSPDGKRIAYSFWNNGERIGIYDVETGAITPLSDDPVAFYIYEDTPSWSSDGSILTFAKSGGSASGIWRKDFTDGSLALVVGTGGLRVQRLSPDGTKIAYTDYNDGLYVYDLASGSPELIDDSVDTYSIEWSPDSRHLAFASYRNGSEEVYILNTETGSQAFVEGSSGEPWYLAWTADGRSVLVDRWSDALDRDMLWIVDAAGTGPARRLLPGMYYLYYVGSAQTGEIAVVELTDGGTSQVHLMRLAGTFEFPSAALNAGENILTVVATDTAGNTGEPSDPISVTYDTSTTPDLAATADGVYLYPPYPIAGERMAVNAVVANPSGVDVENVDVDVYVWNALGQLELLKSETLPLLAAGSTGLVTATWDSAGKTGDNRLIVVVDPDDRIDELDEGNNLAVRDFYVADHIGMSMSIGLDNVQYVGSRDANIGITIRNTGPAASGLLSVQIEDEQGYPVTTFDSQTVSLAYADEAVRSLVWNTGTTYAGSYRVHAVFTGASGETLAESTASFAILSDAAVDLAVTTDKAAYGPRENVAAAFTVRNSGTNSIIPSLRAVVTVSDGADTVLFSEEKTLTNLLPGASVDLNSLWNTGITAPGDYRAVVTVSFDGSDPAAKSAAFRINSAIVLAGSVTASPSVVPAGGAAQIGYTVSNAGNADAQGCTVKVAVLDPETQQVMQTSEEVVDIAANTSRNGQVSVDSGGYGLKTYIVALQVLHQGTTKNLASAAFTVKDLTPPVVTILSPEENGTFNSTIILSVLASDAASGVEAVEYQKDGGPWLPLPVADPSQGRYGTAWEPTIADNGPHTVMFRAADTAGNTSKPVAVGFTIQMDSEPPVTAISVGTPNHPSADLTFVTKDTVFTLTAEDNFSGVETTEYRVDNGAWTAYAPFTLSAADGSHRIFYRSTDKAGNVEADKTLDVFADNTAPVSTGSAGTPQYSSGGDLYLSGRTLVTLTAEDSGSGVRTTEYSVDGGPFAASAGPMTLAAYPDGTHTITYRSVDNLGNTEADRTFTAIVDKTPPVTVISASGPLAPGAANPVSPDTRLTLAAADNLSGVKATAYRVDGGAWQPFMDVVSLASLTAGQHVISYKSTDNVLNEEQEQSVTVLLVVINAGKKIDASLNVLIGAWRHHPECDDRGEGDHDDGNREGRCSQDHGGTGAQEKSGQDRDDHAQCSAVLDRLEQVLASAGIAYRLPVDREDFEASLRSGRYNTYLLLDNEETGLEDELRESVHYGDGLLVLKTIPNEMVSLDDVLGIKSFGETARADLTVRLFDSPVSNEGSIASLGKSVVAAITAASAQGFGTYTDTTHDGDEREQFDDDDGREDGHDGRTLTYPAIVYNQYGRGKAMVYFFDLLSSPDQAQAAALLINSLNYIRPAEHRVRALDSAPVRITLDNSSEQVDVKVVETLPENTTADSITPQATPADNTITWLKSLASGEKAVFQYYLNLPDSAGDYATDTALLYSTGNDYRLYGRYGLTVTIPYDASGLRQEILADLLGITATNRHDAARIAGAMKELRSVDDRGATRKAAERNIQQIMAAAEQLRKLPVDLTDLRVKMDELLKIWEKKWFLSSGPEQGERDDD